ncbi:MAG: SpoIIE family protein phosphatase [Rhodospirillaceae bacterium]
MNADFDPKALAPRTDSAPLQTQRAAEQAPTALEAPKASTAPAESPARPRAINPLLKALSHPLALGMTIVFQFLAFGALFFANQHFTEQDTALQQTVTQSERIIALDQKLSDRLALALASQSTRPVANLPAWRQTKEALLEEGRASAQDPALVADFDQLRGSDAVLSGLETEVLAHFELEDWDAAAALLTVKGYKRERAIHRATLSRVLRGSVLAGQAAERQAAVVVQGIQLTILLLFLGLIAVGYAHAQRLKVTMAGQRHLMDQLQQSQDVLESRVAERTAALGAAERQMRDAIETLPDALVMVDPSGQPELFNQHFRDLPLGDPTQDKPGDAADIAERLRQLLDKLDPTATPGPDGLQRQDCRYGEDRVYDVRRLPRPTGGHVVLLSDVTEYRAAEARLADAFDVISGSISYATRIQQALLPPTEALDAAFYAHYVVWRPRDQVSGDMYWYHQDQGAHYIALYDCTGHGVPGALMTMVVSSALSLAVTETLEPERLLARANALVKTNLRQINPVGSSDDGFEIGLCRVEPDRGRLTFAGARCDLLISQGGALEVIKGDRLNLGYRKTPMTVKPTRHFIRLRDGARYFMVSDGILDQVGTSTRRSFGRRRLVQGLQESGNLPLQRQGDYVMNIFDSHKGQEPQRDDVTLVGFQPLMKNRYTKRKSL